MAARITLLTVVLAAAGSFLLSAADVEAQTSSANPTRSGSLAPAGEGPGAQASAPRTATTRNRADVKEQTRKAERAGTLTPAGESPGPAVVANGNVGEGKAMASTGSVQSRSSVKAQTKSARASGTLQPAGEAAQPYSEPPKK